MSEYVLFRTVNNGRSVIVKNGCLYIHFFLSQFECILTEPIYSNGKYTMKKKHFKQFNNQQIAKKNHTF